MTNGISSISLPFTQQNLQAADAAWQGFIQLQERAIEGSCIPHDLSLLSAFSRFLHELIPNQDIRGQILRELEPAIRQTSAFKQGVA